MGLFQRQSSILKKSILVRMGVAMATILSLAVIGMLSSVIIAETSEGFAAAINQAGTLRMQSYRIASSLVHGTDLEAGQAGEITRGLVEEFEERIYSPRIHNVLQKGISLRVEEAYHIVQWRWQDSFLPQLKAYLLAANSDSSTEDGGPKGLDEKIFYLSNVDSFVDDIHHLVKVLELDAEEKIQQQRLIQIVAMALMLLVVAASMFMTHTSVLIPLRNLLICARAARRGDFSIRSSYLEEDELGQLGQSFNVMAEDLSKTYTDLEERVKEKTYDLEQSNQSLELLYAATKRLTESAPTEEVLQELIHDIERATGIKGGYVCLGKPGDKQAFRLAAASLDGIDNSSKDPLDCLTCLGDGTSHTFDVQQPDQKSMRMFSTPIKDQKQHYGVLVLELSSETGSAELSDWQQRLVETVASHIAMGLNMAQQVSRSRMLSLLEERSVIARELHDSLAQTLSYLKIQVSRLDIVLTEQDPKTALEISGILRSALNGAYRELRELLTTFRLRISEAGLIAALEETVQEYRERSGMDIELINKIGNCQLRPNAEIHVIQIIREALSNVNRHADAENAKVLVECDIEGLVTILIEDDGKGMAMDDDGDMMQHYGLPIMKERAEWLGGNLSIKQSPTGGTSVRLVFEAAESAPSNIHDSFLQRMNYEQ
ncbi:MAG: HAMP domain-containing protein [Gammaproteobacteria bacterium]|nr:HAMP domain-containing protein [Gammaproteobacteria bacterium]